MSALRSAAGSSGGVRSVGIILLTGVLTVVAPLLEAKALWPWQKGQHKHSCNHHHCGETCQNLSPAGFAGSWYWMRSPDQERRVVMALYNRYCIRCHGIDGRGVWDIPDVPDFTDARWQASRPDPQIVNIIMEGRGACMPPFRGTHTLEEACAMAGYLRTFVPGTEISRPEVGRGGGPHGGTEAATPPTPPATSVPPAAPQPTLAPGVRPTSFVVPSSANRTASNRPAGSGMAAPTLATLPTPN
jgi:mono/diheme cytochrome c family protein